MLRSSNGRGTIAQYITVEEEEPHLQLQQQQPDAAATAAAAAAVQERTALLEHVSAFLVYIRIPPASQPRVCVGSSSNPALVAHPQVIPYM